MMSGGGARAGHQLSGATAEADRRPRAVTASGLGYLDVGVLGQADGLFQP
jgi:hypothetical protein